MADPTNKLQIIKDLLTSEKGVFALALIIGATVLAFQGQMSVQEWTDYTMVIYIAFAGGTGLRAIGQGIGNRRELDALKAERSTETAPDATSDGG